MSNLTPSNGGAPGRAEQAAAAPGSTEVRAANSKRSAVRPAALAALVVALTAVLTASTLGRMRQEHKRKDAAAEVATTLPRVTVVRARAMAAEAEQLLPGSARPLQEAGLYPRATGSIKTRLVDIGDRVQGGQLLAVIDAPDLDNRLALAKADLAQAKANWEKAKADAELFGSVENRSRILLAGGRTPRAEYEVKFKNYGAGKAAVGAAEAAIKVNETAVQRLADLRAFGKIAAPFAGVITARHIDPGDLVCADSTARELFHLMRTDILRVFVDVPQVFATDIQVGQSAVVYRREDLLKPFSGKVTRTADALAPDTHTLRTEVQVANADNALRPGMDLQVKFVFRNEYRAILMPRAAVVTRAGAPRVAVLDDQHRVQYRTVQLGRDCGAQIEVLAGLTAGDTAVVHPGDDLPEGTVVDPVHQQPVAR
jgi:RND family efflux transporter MFP subunit